MAYLNQFRWRLSTLSSLERYFCKAISRTIACMLIVLGITLPGLGIATGQQEASVLQNRKAELEVQKLELEIAKLQKDRDEVPTWLMGAFGLLVGIVGTAATVWVARRRRLGALDQSVHDNRLEAYPQLVEATARLAIYFPNNDPSEDFVGPKECGLIGQALSAWYFKGGGLLLSVEARNAYFRLARALTRASLAEELRVPMFPKDAEEISVDKIKTYRAKLETRINLDDVENWRFGNNEDNWPFKDPVSEEDKTALRFKDFIFLQRLSSILRTRLSEDLRSRRRPS